LSKEDVQLDELLARGSLGGPKYDEILQRVLDRTATDVHPRRKRWLTWTLVPGGALAAVCAAWLVCVAPAHRGFVAKGAGETATGALDVGCGPSGGRVCRTGSTLMVTVNTALASGYLGAYAERSGDPSHARIWYFPTASGSTPVVPPGDRTVVVPEGIQIGPEHPPGNYRVTVWVSSRPLGRSEVDQASPDTMRSRSTFELQVSQQ
jgi:hypothetical protein